MARHRWNKAERELMARHKVDDLELVPEYRRDGSLDCVWLWGYGTYERSSVLAGQYKQARLECYKTIEEARAEWPTVPMREDGYCNLPSSMVTNVPNVPPAGFDPMDAGERWDDEY